MLKQKFKPINEHVLIRHINMNILNYELVKIYYKNMNNIVNTIFDNVHRRGFVCILIYFNSSFGMFGVFSFWIDSYGYFRI